jgi:glycogen operon protein
MTFHDPGGEVASGAYLDDPQQHYLGVRVLAGASGDHSRSIYVAYNGGTSPLSATLPVTEAGLIWHRIADTAAWMEPLGNVDPPGRPLALGGRRYDVGPRSLAIFLEQAR